MKLFITLLLIISHLLTLTTACLRVRGWINEGDRQHLRLFVVDNGRPICDYDGRIHGHETTIDCWRGGRIVVAGKQDYTFAYTPKDSDTTYKFKMKVYYWKWPDKPDWKYGDVRLTADEYDCD